MIETVKDDGIAVVAGTGAVIGATVDTTEKVLATTVKDVAKVGVGIEHAAVAVGGGAVKAVGDVGATVADAARHTVHGNPDAQKPEIAKA
jgi:hypothetical protein